MKLPKDKQPRYEVGYVLQILDICKDQIIAVCFDKQSIKNIFIFNSHVISSILGHF